MTSGCQYSPHYRFHGGLWSTRLARLAAELTCEEISDVVIFRFGEQNLTKNLVTEIEIG